MHPSRFPSHMHIMLWLCVVINKKRRRYLLLAVTFFRFNHPRRLIFTFDDCRKKGHHEWISQRYALASCLSFLCLWFRVAWVLVRFQWIARRLPFILSSWYMAQQLVSVVVGVHHFVNHIGKCFLLQYGKKGLNSCRSLRTIRRRDGNERNKSDSMASLVAPLSSSHGTKAVRQQQPISNWIS